MRRWLSYLLFVLSLALQAEEPLVEGAVEEANLPQKTVNLTILEQSLFTDRIGTAVAYFDTAINQPDYWSRESDSCSVVGVEVQFTPDNEQYASAAVIRFLPKQVGVVTLPSLDFTSDEFAYQTNAQQLMVGEPIRSEAMSLSLKPERQQVYVGQPLRIDLVWEARLGAEKLRALRLSPDFFQDPTVQVVIPRSSEPEDKQIGFPIGGRRVIARRTLEDADSRFMGRVSLPIYLRFNEPGNKVLGETRLECAVLGSASGGFGRYAAHFNNGLFEAVDGAQRYQRVYTMAAPVEINVLPLPSEEQGAHYSGLFERLDIDVKVQPQEVKIGELMELEIKLSSDAPHGMLDLPQLSQQPGLRERFIVDDNYGRAWHEQGTIFRTRLRALSTSIRAVPSLQFQVFDSETGTFVERRTEAIPLHVHPSNGENYLSIKSFEGAAVTLSNQPEGIWHTMEANPMNDLLNMLYSIIRVGFWPLVLLGPIAFVLLLPVVREFRRRALDARYRLRVQAYAEFKKSGAQPKVKWGAFLRFMATTFDAGDKAWTRSDSERALQKIGADCADVDRLVEMHTSADAEDFSHQGEAAEFQDLDGLAKRVARLAAKAALCLLFIALLLPRSVSADDWTEAQKLYAQAQALPAGGEVGNALYQDAALKAEAAARANSHPGAAWYNAGNAWFESGHLGRAIAAFRNAQTFFPFDARVADNLAAARAMALNDVPVVKDWWQRLPISWLKLAVVALNLLFWTTLLCALRYRSRSWIVASVLSALALLIPTALLVQASLLAEKAGVVVVDAVYSKKGPGYAYANAFNEPLHDGLEFILVEQRGEWALIQLPDTRQCWLPLSQVQLL